MDGYVMNTSQGWLHKMKRSIGPGAKIPLQELYEQYGVKHELEEGDAFVQWLEAVKLKDKNKWKIVRENDVVPPDKKTTAADENAKRKSEVQSDAVVPPVSTKMDVKDVVGLSVRRAREILPTVMDRQLLKYALHEANQLAGKDSLCKLLRKRIQELHLSH